MPAVRTPGSKKLSEVRQKSRRIINSSAGISLQGDSNSLIRRHL